MSRNAQFWKRFGGMPSEWVLYADEAKARPLLEEAQRKTLRERATTLFKLDFEKLDLVTDEKSPVRRDKLDRWQSVTRQIYTTVRTAGKNARVDAFNRTYGMMVGITVTIAIVATWIQCLLIGPFWPRVAPLGALAFVVAAFTAFRAYVFGKLYARELFVNFLDAADSRP
jgi:hypothetical protein